MNLSRRQWALALAIIAALFLGSAITERLPQPADVSRQPFYRDAAIGQAVNLRTGELTVRGVRGAQELLYFRQVHAANQGASWVVVDLTWTPRGETRLLNLNDARFVAADERSYGYATDANYGCGSAQPGMTIACSVAFEVPNDAIGGATLLVPASADALATADDVARIDLGLDEDRGKAVAADDGRIAMKNGVTP